MEDCNIVLTGLHRSGTTLACYLLNKLPDTVALHEPIKVFKWASLPYPFHEVICRDIDRFFQETRQSLLKNGTAVSKHVGGHVPDNPFARWSTLFHLVPSRIWWRIMGDRGLRKDRASWGVITVEKQLSGDFLLCVKHVGAFIALLDSLSQRYPCYAVVRNPLSILASWNSVNFNPRRGRIPSAEMLDRALAQQLSEIGDRIERQLYILSWCFQRFDEVLPTTHVIYYEEIVASRGKALEVITHRARELDEPLENRNKNKLYDRKLMRALGERLLETDGAFWRFYSRESVRQLLDK